MEMTTDEAAGLLGISARSVRRLVEGGGLRARRAGRTLLVERSSVEERLAQRPSAGRPLSPRSAWDVIAAAGADAERPGMTRIERARLRRRLADLADVAPERYRSRARRTDLRVPPSLVASLGDDQGLILSGEPAAAAHGADIIMPDGIVRAYVRANDLDGVLRRHGARPAEAGRAANLVLRVIPGEITPPWERGARVVPPVLLALDLLDEADPRARRAGRLLLEREAGTVSAGVPA